MPNVAPPWPETRWRPARPSSRPRSGAVVLAARSELERIDREQQESVAAIRAEAEAEAARIREAARQEAETVRDAASSLGALSQTEGRTDAG